MTQYDVGRSQAQANEDLTHFNADNYKDLLSAYSDKMSSILESFGGLEANIPLNHEYFMIRNKYQIVLDKFTKE